MRGVSFELKKGEIYGLAGIEGNGQTELVETLTGLRKAQSGRVELAGKDITHARPTQILKSGLGYVPEDRQVRGLITSFTVSENLVLGYHHQSRFEKKG